MAKKSIETSAREIAKRYGIKVVYANDRGEFFTSKNYALNSVSGDESKITTFNFAENEQVNA